MRKWWNIARIQNRKLKKKKENCKSSSRSFSKSTTILSQRGREPGGLQLNFPKFLPKVK